MKTLSVYLAGYLFMTAVFTPVRLLPQPPKPDTYSHEEVVFYRDNNYQGPCAVRSYGNYPNTFSAGFPNDWASSIKAGQWVQVTLFENANFEGKSIVLRGNIPDLASSSWNDRVSSFKIERAGALGSNPSAGSVIVYKDKNYTGPFVELRPGSYYQSSEIGLKDNNISSLKIGPNTEVVICADEYFQGKRKMFRQSVADLSSDEFNDRVSSINVRRTDVAEAYAPVLFENSDLVKKVLLPVSLPGNKKIQKVPPMTRDVLAIVFDQHQPGITPVTAGGISTLRQMMESISKYYLENSDNRFSVRVAGILGPYAGLEAYAAYNTDQKTDVDGDGFTFGPWKKYKEAIEKASAQYDFSKYDRDGNKRITKEELTIVILIPGSYSRGFERNALKRQVPSPENLTVNGVEIYDPIIEQYMPPNLQDETLKGGLAHELAHRLLNHIDYYNCGVANNFQPGSYSIMDDRYNFTHLDPLIKLKLGWLVPKVITTSCRTSLEAVETSHCVWVLMDPSKGNDEYFIIENRNTAAGLYDRQLPDLGLAIWHVIEKRDIWRNHGFSASGNCVDDWGRRGVGLVRSSLPVNDFTALWKGPSNNSVKLYWADGTYSGFEVKDISNAGKMMSAQIIVSR